MIRGKRGKLGLLAAAVLLVLVTGAWAEETSWKSDVSGYWHDSANWTNGIPDEGKDAVLDHYCSTYLTGTDGITNSVVVGKSTHSNFLFVHDKYALTVINDIQVGVQSSSVGNLSIGSDSSLSVGGNLRVGVGGWSHLDNKGTLQVDVGLYMGEAAGSYSSIFFPSGTGKFSFATIGINGSEASFDQWGGTVTITGGLTCGVNSGSYGSYSVGQSGHTGQLTIDHVVLGEKADSSGGLGAMGGGTANITNSLAVGQVGHGSVMIRYADSSMNAGSIVMAQQPGSTGSFQVLEQGSLSTGSLVVGAGGQEAHFIQGGTWDSSITNVTVNGTLTVGAAPRPGGYVPDPEAEDYYDPYGYLIWVGRLTVHDLMVEHGTFAVKNNSAYIEVAGTAHLGPDAVFMAVPGSTFTMTGADFSVESTNPANMAGLQNLRMVFLGGEGVTDTFEVGFKLGALEIGPNSHVRLVDLFDNNLSGTLGDEGLWVASLILGEGATLDRYGLTLTYYIFSGNPDQIISTPVPGSLLLLGSGLLGLGLLGYRRKGG